MRIRPSITAALSGVGMLALAAVGYMAWTQSQLAGYKPTPVTPGSVTLLGIIPDRGYQIIVSNDVAQLTETTEKKGRDKSEESDAGTRKRIPIREFLGSLQGKPEDLGRLVMALNKITEDDLTGAAAVWKAEDIQKALAGDEALKKQLESDLHIGLDGTPPSEIRVRTLLGGIVIDSPVEMKVPMNGETKKIICRIQEPFMSRFGREMERKIGERFNPSADMIRGLYRDLAAQQLEKPEDIRKGLENQIDAKRLANLATKPESLLESAFVIMNEQSVEGAKYSEWTANDGKKFADIELKLTEDGRKRLWKFSTDRKEFQLLFVVNDIALAAPKIGSILSQREVTMRQLPNRGLAQKSADYIQSLAKKGGK